MKYFICSSLSALCLRLAGGESFMGGCGAISARHTCVCWLVRRFVVCLFCVYDIRFVVGVRWGGKGEEYVTRKIEKATIDSFIYSTIGFISKDKSSVIKSCTGSFNMKDSGNV